MANLFEQYGIKEVADVTFYDTATGAPALYLDTLKVSTIEETAQQSAATGGKGNASLIVWDYGKEITLNLEDALFSMKSMAIMHGGKISKTGTVQRAKSFRAAAAATVPSDLGIPSSAKFYNDAQEEVASANISANERYIATWNETVASGGADVITINAENFPGTYKVVGDTYARSYTTGKDEFFQFVIPMAKMNAEKTITMQAEGDPSTFSMSLRVLRPEDGNMMKLIKYPISNAAAASYASL